MNRTAWFIADINPIHVGWYEVKYDGLRGISKLYWSGSHWYYNPDTPLVNSVGASFGKWPADRWRGLAEKS